jgi:hypothetical protein
VSRLAHDQAWKALAQGGEERLRHFGLVGEARGKLHQQRAKSITEAGDLGDKAFEWR